MKYKYSNRQFPFTHSLAFLFPN